MKKFYIEYLIAQHGLEKDRETIIEADNPRLASAALFLNIDNVIDIVCMSDITSDDQDDHFSVEVSEFI